MVTRRQFVGSSAAGSALLLAPALGCSTAASVAPLELHPGEGVAHFSPEGDVYELLPNEHALRTPRGTIGGAPSDAIGAFNYPIGLVHSDSSFFVLELGGARVQRFDLSDRPVAAFGEYGTGEAQFARPRDITLGAGGLLYIADSLNHRVQVFTQEGRFVRAIGSAETLNSARSVAIDAQGDVHIATEASVEVFAPSGGYLGSYASELHSPRCVRIDINGDSHVVDSVLGVVTRFDSQGRALDTVSPEGTPAWLSLHPSGALRLTVRA
ncbi:MAG: NHL repeat-containing protein [Polyangiales bacterium]